jgi:hypothetical protein
MIDWWMIFCMLILVTTMAFHTFLNFLVRNANQKLEEEFNYLARSKEIKRKMSRAEDPGCKLKHFFIKSLKFVINIWIALVLQGNMQKW